MDELAELIDEIKFASPKRAEFLAGEIIKKKNKKRKEKNL